MKTTKITLLVVYAFISTSVMAGQVRTTLDGIGAIKITIPNTPVHYNIGISVAGINDFDGDGFQDVAIGAPDYEPSGFVGNDYGNGAVYIVFGHQLNRDRGEIDLSSPEFDGIAIMGRMSANIGQTVAAAGDINADNFADLVFGSKSRKAGETLFDKSSYVLFGSAEPRRRIPIADLNDDGVEVTQTGFSLSPGGDVNGDGYPDVIFANPYSEKKTINGKDHFLGRVSVVFGRSKFPSTIDSLDFNDFLIPYYNPMTLGSEVGYSVCGGFDWDADGLSDYFIVAPKGGHDRSGRAYLIQGRESVTLDGEPNVLLTILHARYYVRCAGDINADGYTDFFAGAENNRVVLLWGGAYPKGDIVDLHNLPPERGITMTGAQSAYGAGDFNGDGFPDFAVGLPATSYVGDKAMAGQTVFICGRSDMPNTIDIKRLCDGEETFLDYVVVDGLEAYGSFGASVAAIGDIQGNGFDDVIVGAPSIETFGDETRRDSPGAAYVIQGRSLFESLQAQRSLFPAQSRAKKQTASEAKTLKSDLTN